MPHDSPTERSNLRGSLLMLAGMAGFACEDAVIKHLSATLSVAQILLLLGAGGALVFSRIVRRQGGRFVTRDFLLPPVILRFAGELIGSIGMVTSLALVSLSVTSTIIQALPFLTTIGAFFLLGEPVGWRRWSAIAVGFAGVLLVLRPWGASFDPAMLFAVMGVCGMAIRDLATRRAPPRVSTMQLAGWGFGALVPAGLLLLALGQPLAPVPPSTVLLLLLCLALGMSSYWAIITANRIADMGVIAPFRYTRMIFGLGLGIAVFGERPAALTFAGAALILGAGLYTLWRETRLRRKPSPGPAGPL